MEMNLPKFRTSANTFFWNDVMWEDKTWLISNAFILQLCFADILKEITSSVVQICNGNQANEAIIIYF